MANYAIGLGQKAPIIDQDSNPIAEGTTSVVIADGTIVSLTATAGFLFLTAGAAGSTDVAITFGTTTKTHTVTVGDSADFDWSLGDAVPA